MFMTKRELKPLEKEGVTYYSIGQVAEMTDKSVQTVRLWCEWSDAQEEEGKPRFVPKPRTDLDERGTRYFHEKDIPAIIKFSKNVPYGLMSPYNRKRWGERGKHVTIDKSMERMVKEGRKEEPDLK